MVFFCAEKEVSSTLGVKGLRIGNLRGEKGRGKKGLIC